ncbi:MAG: carbamoyltransferase HypF [Pseudomonadales bacterium]|jgi:hydrogenase maturation protein HypF|nr:carbamoyltransferase HypF [Pseudomonadales bacterium]
MERREIRIRGRVQGVGFRPAVWQLARRHGIAGAVMNDGEGLLIRACAASGPLQAFLHALRVDAPPLARIDAIEIVEGEGAFGEDFRILPSEAQGSVHTDIGPDAATCPACTREVLERGHRRSGYALTNCTHCGPRLSIVRRLPWDRQHTTMADYPLCVDCAAEYADPADRRFHAEPIACPACGPTLTLRDADGLPCGDGRADPIDASVTRLAAGAILAVKGIGGFHLICDARDDAAIRRLRQRKGRPHKPLAVMFPDLAAIEALCHLSPAARRELRSAATPVVVLALRDAPGDALPEALAPGLHRLGCMVPHSPLQHLLLRAHGGPLVMTSGNRSGMPQCTDNARAVAELRGIVDGFLWHDRAIVNRLDDSVVRHDQGGRVLLRRARGFAPDPLPLPEGLVASPPLLALGADLKNAFCIATDHRLILSQHLGDLSDPRARDEQAAALDLYASLLDADLTDCVVDLHPSYASRRHGEARCAAAGGTLHEVQHHHAHVAACLVDNDRAASAPPVLGIALDGLGLGTDGGLWGGEFLLADYGRCDRLGHLAAVALPGGDAAAREPWRNLLAQCLRVWAPDALEAALAGTSLGTALADRPVLALTRLIEQGTACPAASSAGRLFDAVAAALGVAPGTQSHEGQAALQLEDLALSASDDARAGAYPLALLDGDEGLILDPAPLWPALLEDMRQGTHPALIAWRFHEGLARALAGAATQLSRIHDFREVALTGGVFQNALLRDRAKRALATAGFSVLVHRRIPASDGGIAVGQAAIALFQRQQGGRPSCVSAFQG